MPLPSAGSFVGIAKEATKGTGVAATAFIPVNQFDPIDNISYIADNGWRGAPGGPYNQIPGPLWSTFTIAGDVYPDTIPWVAAGLLGDLVTTGSVAPFTHTIALKNSGDMQPGSKTLTDFYAYTGTHTRQYAGVQFGGLDLKFNADGKLEYSATAAGLASTLVAKPTQSFTTIPPYPTWVGTTTIGGSLVTNCQIGDVSIKRNAMPLNTVDGSQAPYAIFVGPVTVDGKMTIIMEDDTELLRFLANTQPSLAFNWTQGAGAAVTQVQITMAKVAYVAGAIKRGNDYITTEIGFSALMNATDVGASAGYGPMRIICQNAVAASVYA